MNRFPKSDYPSHAKPRPPAGEVFVWLTSLGLALGILMSIGLIVLIFWKGVSFFWPRNVVELTVRAPANPGTLGSENVWGGAVVKKQAKRSDIALKLEIVRQEWQLFVGNKDTYGHMYRYIDVDAITSVERPKGVAVAERTEYGKAIFYPISITMENGVVIPAETPDFIKEWRLLVKKSNDRKDEIYTIEKRKIGKVNAALESLRLKQRRLLKKTSDGLAHKQKLSEIEEKMAVLQAEYEVFASQARQLRAKQKEVQLTYKLLSGEILTQPMGEILYFYFPNQMNFWHKLHYFVTHFWLFLSEDPREANTEGGVFPAFFGTFVMTLLLSVAVTPFGVIAAVYLREYAKEGPIVQSVRIAVNNLAGVPSIVFGVFGLGFFVYGVGGTIDDLFFADRLPTPTFGTGGILWASLTLALMTLPVVIVASEEALAAVPRGVREASLACGASQWQTVQRILLPAAAPGILTGLILAMARGAGEVAPLMLVGVVKLAPSLPVDGFFPFIHLERKFMHLGFHIYDLGFQSPDSEAAKPMVFATTLLLIVLVIILNLGAILIRNHLRKKYMTSIF